MKRRSTTAGTPFKVLLYYGDWRLCGIELGWISDSRSWANSTVWLDWTAVAMLSCCRALWFGSRAEITELDHIVAHRSRMQWHTSHRTAAEETIETDNKLGFRFVRYSEPEFWTSQKLDICSLGWTNSWCIDWDYSDFLYADMYTGFSYFFSLISPFPQIQILMVPYSQKILSAFKWGRTPGEGDMWDFNFQTQK